MNDKGKSSFKSYIALFVIMLCAMILIFYLLISAVNERKRKPLSNNESTTTKITTTKIIDDTESTTTKVTTTTTTKKLSIIEEVEEDPLKDEPVIVTNFKSSLSEITKEYRFEGNYHVELRYSGAKFNFNCTNFDKLKNKCVAGSGLMDAGTALIPLYTYSKDEDNYLTRPKDYHVIITDQYIILSFANSFKETGMVKIYDRKGKFIVELKDLILSYKVDNKEHQGLYPTLNENSIYYYTCDSNLVKVYGFDISNLNSLGLIEQINGTCY